MSPTPKPNILVIISDDQGYGDVACYGNKIISTPSIDQLAASGVTFTQHYTASPICAPARAALLTGLYNHMTGALSVESNRGIDRIHTSIMTIADHMKSLGYHTGLIGKWHNGSFSRNHHPNSRGFDDFVGFLNGAMDYYDWYLDYNGTSKKSDGRYLTDVFATEAVEFISRNHRSPFFLTVAFNAPHAPFQAPAKLIKKYEEERGLGAGVSRIYAMIEQMDSGIGRILEKLKETGLDKNTVVLFTSDNGPLLGKRAGMDLVRYNGPFRGGKTSTLEGGIRVPAILRWPDSLPSQVMNHNMTHFIDWLPTLLEIAGGKEQSNLSSSSRLKSIQNQTVIQTPRFWQYNRYDPVPRCNAAMRDGKWKLSWSDIPEAMKKITADNDWYKKLMHEPHFFRTLTDNPSFERNIPAPGEPQLYDLESDPMEKFDLSQLHPRRVAKMTIDLDNWFSEVNESRLALLGRKS